MLTNLDHNLWVAEQPLRYFGLSIGTRMTVIRLANNELANNELVVISPIQLTPALTEALQALGNVAQIIAPNLYHYLFAAEFKAAYPAATFWATAGLEAKQPALAIDQVLTDNVPSPWPGLELLFFDGFKTLSPRGPDPLAEWVFFHSSSRTLILTDTAFYFDNSFPWLTQAITAMGGSYKCLRPSLLERLAITDTAQVKASIEQVLHWDFERVIMAHGSVVNQAGKEQLKRGYEAFLGCSL